MNKDALSYLPGDAVADRYRITGVLGRGGFGAVYAAEHLGTGQPMAIKMMSAPPHDAIAVERFFREARITAKLAHANTVRVFDAGRDGSGPLYMVMEMLRGPTLEQVLQGLTQRRRPLTVPEAVELGGAILRSLAEAHRAGLVHRDLKPANIMLHRVPRLPDQVKVLDFGCSLAVDSQLPPESATVGTPAYMSPEQCLAATIDARSDLYTVAVILFRCVTLRLPFEDRVALTLLYKHAHQAPPDPCRVAPQELPPAFCQLILQGLAKDKADRFADAATMRKALQAFVSPGLASAPTQMGHRAARGTVDRQLGAVLARVIDAATVPFQAGQVGVAQADSRQLAAAIVSDFGQPTLDQLAPALAVAAATRADLGALADPRTLPDGARLAAASAPFTAPAVGLAAGSPQPSARGGFSPLWLGVATAASLAVIAIALWVVTQTGQRAREPTPVSGGPAAAAERPVAAKQEPVVQAPVAGPSVAAPKPVPALTPIPLAPMPLASAGSATVAVDAVGSPGRRPIAAIRTKPAKPRAQVEAPDRPRLQPRMIDD